MVTIRVNKTYKVKAQRVEWELIQKAARLYCKRVTLQEHEDFQLLIL